MTSRPSAAESHVQDSAVGVVRDAVLVAVVAGGEPQAAVRGGFDGAQPPELAGEERLHTGQFAARGDRAPIEPFPSLTGDVQGTGRDRDAGARTLRRRVG